MLQLTSLGLGAPADTPEWLLGAIISPGEQNQLTTLPGPPPSCNRCRACLPSPAASCLICSPGKDDIASKTSVAAVDYVGSIMKQPASLAMPRILAIDVASHAAALDTVKAAAVQVLDTAADDTPIALIAFGEASAAFRLLDNNSSIQEVHYADVFPFVQQQSSGGTQHVGSIKQHRQQLLAIVRSLRPQRSRPKASSFSSLPRLVGVVESAVALAREFSTQAGVCSNAVPSTQSMDRPAHAVNSQLIIISDQANLASSEEQEDENDESSGNTNELLSSLAALASNHGIIIDTVLSGGSNVALSTLSSNTGGLALPVATSTEALVSRIKAALRRDVASACAIQVHCSAGLKVKRVLGPAMELEQQDDNELPKTYVGHPPDANQGFGLILQQSSCSHTQHHASYLQIVLAWTRSSDGATIWRVLTAQLPSETSLQHQCDVAAVLFAKSIASEALARGACAGRMQAEILRKRIVSQMQQAAMSIGDPDLSNKGWFSLGPSRYLLPAEATSLAITGFGFHQRTLSLHHHQSSESYLSTLLAAPHDVSLRMIVPQLYTIVNSKLQPVTTPLALALMLSAAGIVDAGSTVFVWLSSKLTDKDQQRALVEAARSIACKRNPQADVVQVFEGDENQGSVLQRLLPVASGAGAGAQLRHALPWIASLPAEDIKRAAQRVYELSHNESDDVLSLGAWLAEVGIVLLQNVNENCVQK